MTVRRIFFLFLILIVVAVAILTLKRLPFFDEDEDQSQSPESLHHQDPKNTHSKETDTDNALRASILLNGLEQMRNGEPVLEEEESEISPEEKNRLLTRMAAIQDVYWEEAPRILAQMMEEQPHNDAWTESSTLALEDFLKDDRFSGTKQVSLECRQRLCRIELIHTNRDAYDIFRKGSIELPMLSGNVHGSEKQMEDNSISTTIFFSKGRDHEPFEEMKDRMLAKVEGL